MSGSAVLRRRITIAVAVAATTAIATSISAGVPADAGPKPAKDIPVQLFSFNDYHGHIEEDAASATAADRRQRP